MEIWCSISSFWRSILIVKVSLFQAIKLVFFFDLEICFFFAESDLCLRNCNFKTTQLSHTIQKSKNMNRAKKLGWPCPVSTGPQKDTFRLCFSSECSSKLLSHIKNLEKYVCILPCSYFLDFWMVWSIKVQLYMIIP